MAKELKKKVVTRKEMSHLRREQRQRTYIIAGSIGVFALVVGIVVFGLLYEMVIQGMKTVANVNGDRITLNEFQKEIRYQRLQSIRTYQSYAQIYNALGPEVGASFLGNLQQIEQQLSETNKATFGSQVLQQLVENELIAQYASENGISVSQDEIDKALQEAFGYYAQGTATPENTPTSFVTSTLSAEQYAIVSPTPTFAPPTATVVEPTATPDPAQSETPQTEETAAPSATEASPEGETDATITPTIEPFPTETPYTFESYESSVDSLVDELGSIDYSRADLENLFRMSLLREKVYEALTQDIETVQEMVWARHILVADEATANEVLLRLNDGDDWAILAAEYSIDESNKFNGGDLGWFFKGRMVAPFEEAAYSLEIGEIGQPVETENGWHIIQALGHEIRPLTASDLETSKSAFFGKWLEEQKALEGVEIMDNWANDVPVEPIIPPDLLIES
jgi:peptidyl-prolyl cis-trans isomerase D